MWAGIELPTPSCDSSWQYYHIQNIAFEVIILHSVCTKHVSSSSGDAVVPKRQLITENCYAIQICPWGDSTKDTASSKINIMVIISKRKSCTYYCFQNCKLFI